MKNFFTSSLDQSSSDTFDAQIDALKAGESVYLEGVDSDRYMELYEKYKKERNNGKLRFVRDSRPTELDVFNEEKTEEAKAPVEVVVPAPAPEPAPKSEAEQCQETCESEECEDGCVDFDGASDT
jgi:aryl carrier-like protein